MFNNEVQPWILYRQTFMKCAHLSDYQVPMSACWQHAWFKDLVTHAATECARKRYLYIRHVIRLRKPRSQLNTLFMHSIRKGHVCNIQQYGYISFQFFDLQFRIVQYIEYDTHVTEICLIVTHRSKHQVSKNSAYSRTTIAAQKTNYPLLPVLYSNMYDCPFV